MSNAIERSDKKFDDVAFAEWKQWAAEQADRLDPVLSGQIAEHLLPG